MQDQIKEFYESYNEDGRLTRHDLEFARSKEIISRYLTEDKVNIADIGGASGVYSFWLASLGHNVHLLDLTPKHIEQAKVKAESTGVHRLEYLCADARQLPFENESFDLVLEMGPLYHLQSRDDRISALRESYRVLRKGCPVICAVISRYASMIDGFKFSLAKDKEFREILANDIVTGCHNNPKNIPNYFTTAYFHLPSEINDELKESGFSNIELIAVEGFATALDTDELFKDQDTAPHLLEYLRKTESAPELIGISGHIIAVGRKK